MSNTFNLPKNNKKRIVIIGAGFAGLKLARKLADSKYQVVVIDKRNFHQFQPLFYQVASAGIEPSSISFPVRKVFQDHSNLHFRNTTLLKIEAGSKEIITEAGNLSFDYLVIASGVNTNYFGNKHIEAYGLSMKSTAEAIHLRNRIIESFELAILTEDKAEQEKLLSVAIVGGGPTGVELAGAVAEMKNSVLPKDYPELDFSLMKIRLYEAGPRLLAGMSDKASANALKFLKKLQVEVHLKTMIKDYDGEEIVVTENERIRCQNFIWTAGVSGEKVDGLSDSFYTRGNRMPVDRNNKVFGMEGVFAIGDIAYMETDKYPQGHPQVAQVAIQQANLLGKNLKTDKWLSFEYLNKGAMATIGRNMAVCDLPGWKFSGTFAWFVWLLVHLMSIVGVKNRMFIFINWAQSYFSHDQSLRILVRPFRKE